MYKKISLILCILWMGFIFYNSSQDGTQSNGLSYKIIDRIITIHEKAKEYSGNHLVFAGGNVSNAANNERVSLNLEIRKVAHAFEFFVLAILLANAFFAYNIKGKKAIIYILFIVLFYAVTDEYHQLYVKGRNSNVRDVCIDFFGGVIGMTLFYIGYYSKKSKKFYKRKKKS
ncbi:VanZ family protein [Clostridium sp. HBUAS56017]|uniref:VanZ family protein n=1 Tax=Clostridium sp. HBUAS56017 TaxID=2571128 RepID=UPI001178AEF0|nr:VanZ family protein [Clostridium sp. HBUAS56017]